MKTNILILAIVLSSSAFSSCDRDDDRIISRNKLPETVQAFLNTHFPGITETRVEKDRDSYDIHLSNGTEIEFDRSGNWNNIDGNWNVIPATVIDLLPAGITDYLSLSHPGASVFGIDKEIYGYELDLSNGWDVRFNPEGNFLSQTRD